MFRTKAAKRNETLTFERERNHKLRWQDNIKICRKEMKREDVHCVILAEYWRLL